MRKKLMNIIATADFEPVKGVRVTIGARFTELFIGRIADRLIKDGVVIPVRCKDCKHWNVHPINGRLTIGKCLKLSRVMGDTSFCSYGERRNDA